MHTMAQTAIPAGVQLIQLKPMEDARGMLAEIFRESWLDHPSDTPVQWNFVQTKPGVLRGVHLHRLHTDYLVLLTGQMQIGLRDVREASPTLGQTSVVELNTHERNAIFIPPGVMHGFYFPQESQYIYGVNHYWDPNDELGCHWQDPALEIPWKIGKVALSDRDANASSFHDMMASIPPIPYTR